jgi:F0F1-type ATP synthase membrane subunit b/b'
MIQNARRLNEENTKLLEQVQDELKRLKFQQMKNIDKGFFELQKKLEDKKIEIKNEFEKRFKKEEQKFMTKHSLVVANLDEIANIQKVFDQLLSFIDSNPDAKIL